MSGQANKNTMHTLIPCALGDQCSDSTQTNWIRVPCHVMTRTVMSALMLVHLSSCCSGRCGRVVPTKESLAIGDGYYAYTAVLEIGRPLFMSAHELVPSTSPAKRIVLRDPALGTRGFHLYQSNDPRLRLLVPPPQFERLGVELAAVDDHELLIQCSVGGASGHVGAKECVAADLNSFEWKRVSEERCNARLDAVYRPGPDTPDHFRALAEWGKIKQEQRLWLVTTHLIDAKGARYELLRSNDLGLAGAVSGGWSWFGPIYWP